MNERTTGRTRDVGRETMQTRRSAARRRPSSVVLATVPGLGRPRPRRRGEARGVNVYEADAASLTVTTFAWDGAAFAETGRRTFPRG